MHLDRGKGFLLARLQWNFMRAQPDVINGADGLVVKFILQQRQRQIPVVDGQFSAIRSRVVFDKIKSKALVIFNYRRVISPRVHSNTAQPLFLAMIHCPIEDIPEQSLSLKLRINNNPVKVN